LNPLTPPEQDAQNSERDGRSDQDARDAQFDRVEQLGTYEMLWDCKFCGTENLPAKTHRFCPNCGATQDPKTRRFPSDAEKRAVTDHVYKGADLICAACSTNNTGDAHFCRNCGAPLENAARAALLGDQVRDERAQFERDGLSAQTVAAPPARKGPPWAMIAIIGAVVLAVVGAVVAFTWQRDTRVQVVGHQWERYITIEQFAAVGDSAWCDQMPGDAYSVSSRREQRDTRRVPDGEECQVRRVDNGDGTFSERRECTTVYRDEPIYDDRCYFTVNRWTEARTLDAAGESLRDAPRWPLLQLSTCPTALLGCEREGGRTEDYTLTFQSAEGDTFTCQVPQDFWQNASIESAWSVEVGVLTGQPDCASITAPGG
jgi:hypothetical protein